MPEEKVEILFPILLFCVYWHFLDESSITTEPQEMTKALKWFGCHFYLWVNFTVQIRALGKFGLHTSKLFTAGRGGTELHGGGIPRERVPLNSAEVGLR